MDKIELIASLLGVVYLALQYRASAWMWVFSLMMSLLYTYINFSHHLYANFCLQAIFSVLAVVGLMEWLGLRNKREPRPITSMPRRLVAPVVGATLLMTAAIMLALQLTGNSDILLFDSLTTAINLTGTWMLIRKYYQEWICWMVVDPLMSVMYALEGMWLSAALYALFSVVVVFGYLNWKKQAQTTKEHE